MVIVTAGTVGQRFLLIKTLAK